MSASRSSGLGQEAAQSRGSRLLHLLAVCGLAVAQPLFEVVGRHPEFAIAHRLDLLDLLALAAILSLGVGGVIWLLVVAVSLVSRRAASWSQSAMVGLGLGTLPLALLSDTEAGLPVRSLLLALAAALLALAYSRSAVLRRFLTALAVAAVVFPVLFLWRVVGAGSLTPTEAGTPSSTHRRQTPLTLTLAEGPRPPVVLVILDELPLASLLADDTALDAARFPNFAALAGRSHWFRNATTVSQSTSAAVPAILTGRYPRGQEPPTAEGHPANLFALLAEHYELNVFEKMTSLCAVACGQKESEPSGGDPLEPPRLVRLHLALEDLAAVFLALRLPGLGPVVTDEWSGYWDASQVDAAEQPDGEAKTNRWAWQQPPQRFARFLARLKDSPRETLHAIHLSLPHVPWQYLPDGRRYPRERGEMIHGLERAGKWRDSEWEVTQAQQRHLLQLQYADYLLGELVSTLDQAGLLTDSLLVVTADHGASFRPGDNRRIVTSSNLADIAHVPLLVKLPGQTKGVAQEGNVETIDIVPTVLEVLGAGSAGGGLEIDGVSLFAGGRASDTKTIYRSSFHHGAGKPLEFPVAELLETSWAVKEKNRRFPEPSLFAIGRDRRLIGRPVSEMRVLETSGGASVAGAESLERVNPAARVLPVHLMGELVLESPVAAPQRLAVALDGVVRAVSETYGDLPAERPKFSALLDPAVLHGGRHRLAIYRVSDQEILTPLDVALE